MAVLVGLVGGAWSSGVLAAQDVDVWPFAALRVGGSLPVEGGRLRLASSPAFGGAVGYRASDGARVEVLYVQQATSASVSRSSGGPSQFDLTVRHALAGAVYRRGTGGVEPYLTLAVGLANLDPHEAGREQAWGLVGTGGGGLMVPVTTAVTIRLDGRLWLTSLRGPDALFCTSGGGCIVSASGPLLWEGQLAAGVGVSLP